MTSWIFGIDAANPEHWALAKQNGLWHLTTRPDVRRGDAIYFWQAKLPPASNFKPGLLGMVRATADIRTMAAAEAMPWNIADDKRDRYRYRVDFDVITPDSTSTATWSELEKNTGVRGATNLGPRRVNNADGERWLRWQVDGVDGAGVSGTISMEELVARLLPTDGEGAADQRRKVEATIVVREGQGAFRDGLELAYGNRCAVTGVSAPVLDAAHIQPYKGARSNVLANGILLRTDLHTLFDKFLLTITYDGTTYHVRVADSVAAEMYRRLDGSTLQSLPERVDERPHPDLLDAHNQQCHRWLK